MTECGEIIIVMDTIGTKKTNTIATNVTITASINWHGRKVKDCYILHSFTSDHITIDIITFFITA